MPHQAQVTRTSYSGNLQRSGSPRGLNLLSTWCATILVLEQMLLVHGLPHMTGSPPAASVRPLTIQHLRLLPNSLLTDAINRIFPVKTIKLHATDKPWITPELKLMIKDRHRAFPSGNAPAWRSLKYKFQREIAKRKKSFYKNKVKHLKNDDCRKWWKIINKN